MSATLGGRPASPPVVHGATSPRWQGPADAVAYDAEGMLRVLHDLQRPCYAVRDADRVGLTGQGWPAPAGEGGLDLLAAAGPLLPEALGDPRFRAAHGVRLAYMAGSMAGGIASEALVAAMGSRGLLASFGAAGLLPERIEAAIMRVRQVLPGGPHAFNLIHSPSEAALERAAVDLYLRHGVRTVEASAFLGLTPDLVRYRVAGLSRSPDGAALASNRVIAKVSRREVAQGFLLPPPREMVAELLGTGQVTPEQAALAAEVPMADDLTVEADSGGHTDNRPLVCLLPSMIALRDEIQARRRFPRPVRIGAAGGIATPEAALAGFMMGAAYVVTGSINQATVEAGTSAHTKRLLAQAGMADVMMAPAADMFEQGVKVQLLKRGTFFPLRAQKLYELYRSHDSLEAIPATERQTLERQVFRKGLGAVWEETVAYFAGRDPQQISRAQADPRRKMALVFRWYLGLSSRWSSSGEPGREMDYQIWCGPAMGAFNDWARGSYLEDPANRHAPDLAEQIMRGAAYRYRLQGLALQGLALPDAWSSYRPAPPATGAAAT